MSKTNKAIPMSLRYPIYLLLWRAKQQIIRYSNKLMQFDVKKTINSHKQSIKRKIYIYLFVATRYASFLKVQYSFKSESMSIYSNETLELVFPISMSCQQFLQLAYLPQTDESSCNKHNSAQLNDELNHSFYTEQSAMIVDKHIQSKESYINHQSQQKSKKSSRNTSKRLAKEHAKQAKEDKLANEKEANRINASKLSEAFLPQFFRMHSKDIITMKSNILCRRVFQWDNSIYKQPQKTPKTLFKKLQRELL